MSVLLSDIHPKMESMIETCAVEIDRALEENR